MSATTQNTVASLEVAHTYAPNRLVRLEGVDPNGNRLWSETDIAASSDRISQLEQSVCERFGLEAGELRRQALLDDVVARDHQSRSADEWRWELFIGASRESVIEGTSAEVHSEASFVWRGRELQTIIQERAQELGLVADSEGKIFIPTSDGTIGVKIFGFKGVSDLRFPSCAVLDLAWTENRIGIFTRSFTALPLNYRDQQRQVAALAALINLAGRETVTSLLLDSEGKIVEEFGFGDLEINRKVANGTRAPN